MNDYIGNVKEAFSQLINAVTGGYPDEMLSARAYRTDAWFRSWIDAVLGSGHCEEMFRHEFTRKSQHPYYRLRNRC